MVEGIDLLRYTPFLNGVMRNKTTSFMYISLQRFRRTRKVATITFTTHVYFHEYTYNIYIIVHIVIILYFIY